MAEQEKQHLKNLDRKIVWHPFTQMQDYAQEDPVIIARGDGVYLEDIDGNRYLDGFSSMWCNIHGHRVPDIDTAIRNQLDQVAHSTLLGLSNLPAIRLAEKLVHITPPDLTRVFYSDNGATAVEIAVKMAFQYWQQRPDPRPKKKAFLHLTESYHGDTLGSVSVGGISLFHEIYRPLLFPTHSVPVPHPYRCENCLGTCDQSCQKTLQKTIEEHADETAAFIIEPLIQGAGGMLMHPEGYLKFAAELCKQNDILLIVDEVATGFGRTGTMFACEQENVTPDILCLGKGLTGGYLPVAATLVTDEIYNAFLGEYTELKTFYHGHTYTGNPLGCAAALATLNLFEKQKTLEKLSPKIEYLRQSLTRFETLSYVGDIRQRGFIAAIELVADRETRTPFPWQDKIGIQVCQEARNKGLLIRPLINTIVLMPPLNISGNDLQHMLDITYNAIHTVTDKNP